MSVAQSTIMSAPVPAKGSAGEPTVITLQIGLSGEPCNGQKHKESVILACLSTNIENTQRMIFELSDALSVEEMSRLRYPSGEPVLRMVDGPAAAGGDGAAAAAPPRQLEAIVPPPRRPAELTEAQLGGFDFAAQMQRYKYLSARANSYEQGQMQLYNLVCSSLPPEAKRAIANGAPFSSLSLREIIKRCFTLYAPITRINAEVLTATTQIKLTNIANLKAHVDLHQDAFVELGLMGLTYNPFHMTECLITSLEIFANGELKDVILDYRKAHKSPAEANYNELKESLTEWYDAAKPTVTSAKAGYAMEATATTATAATTATSALEAKFDQLLLVLQAGMTSVQHQQSQKQDKTAKTTCYCFTHGDNNTHDTSQCRRPNEAHKNFIAANNGQLPSRSTPQASVAKPGDGWARRSRS